MARNIPCRPCSERTRGPCPSSRSTEKFSSLVRKSCWPWNSIFCSVRGFLFTQLFNFHSPSGVVYTNYHAVFFQYVPKFVSYVGNVCILLIVLNPKGPYTSVFWCVTRKLLLVSYVFRVSFCLIARTSVCVTTAYLLMYLIFTQTYTWYTIYRCILPVYCYCMLTGWHGRVHRSHLVSWPVFLPPNVHASLILAYCCIRDYRVHVTTAGLLLCLSMAAVALQGSLTPAWLLSSGSPSPDRSICC